MLHRSINIDDEPFLGRLEEQDRFREALRVVQRQSRAIEKVKDLISDDEQDTSPFLFLLYGEGGMGKSRLAARLRDIAVHETPFKRHFRVIWLDWERRKELDYRLAARDSLSPEVIFEHLYAVFRDEGFGREFDLYEESIKQRTEAEKKVAQALNHPTAGNDRYAAIRELGSKGLAWLLRTGLPAGAALPEEPTAKVFEAIIGSGAEALAQAREAATTLLRTSLSPDEFDLFTLPYETLARHLATGMRASSARKSIVLVLDTYEIADREDAWIRQLVKLAGQRMVWVIAGRDNLADSRKYGQKYLTGYRAEFGSRKLRVFPLGEFSINDVSEYFAERVPDRVLDIKNAEDLHRATLGIPLAVRAAAAIWKAGISLDDITKNVPPRPSREQIVKLMTERFLVHCFDDPNHPNDRVQLYALALANRPDPNLIAALLSSENLEHDLSDLERRYSFVFVSEMKLHDAVSSFLREYLLISIHRASKEVSSPNEKAVAYLRALLKSRELKAQTLEARINDNRWTVSTLDLVHHSFWLEEDAGWLVLTAAFVGGLAYDRSFAVALLGIATQFLSILSESGKNRLKVLSEGIGSVDPDEGSIPIVSFIKEIKNTSSEKVEAMLAELEFWSHEWTDDGCNIERHAILDFRHGASKSSLEDELPFYMLAGQKLPTQSKVLRSQLADALSLVALGLAFSGRSNEGIPIYEQAVRIDSGNATAHHSLGHIYRDLQRSEEAIKEFQRAIVLEPKNPYHYYCLGDIYQALGRYDEAIASFQECIKLNPRDEDPSHRLGHLYFDQLKDYERATESFRRAIEGSPKGAYLYNDLGVSLAASGYSDEALAAFKQAKDLDSEMREPYIALGMAYLNLKRYDDALSTFQEMIKLEPQNDAALTAIGKIFQHKKQPEQSIEFYLKAIEYDKTDADCAEDYASLGSSYVELGRFTDAIDAYRRAIERNPTKASFCISLGSVLESVERREEAISVYTKATEIAPNDPNSYHGLGHCLQNAGRTPEALQAFQRASELDPKAAALHNDVGNSYRMLKRFDDAITAYLRVVELSPKYAAAHAHLAACYGVRGNKVEREQHILRARELSSEASEYDRACIEALCENTEEALVLLKTAIEKEQRQKEEVLIDPDFRSIRDDARFKELVAK